MPSVFVLEDDDDLRRVMKDIFAFLGASNCLTAGSVAELLANSEDALQSDLAILDVNLGPGLPTGIDAYNWLLSSGYRGRIVFLTGHASNHPLVMNAAKLPGVTVFEKPIDLDQFQQLLESRP